jgi:hypothetical protein
VQLTGHTTDKSSSSHIRLRDRCGRAKKKNNVVENSRFRSHSAEAQHMNTRGPNPRQQDDFLQRETSVDANIFSLDNVEEEKVEKSDLCFSLKLEKLESNRFYFGRCRCQSDLSLFHLARNPV